MSDPFQGLGAVDNVDDDDDGGLEFDSDEELEDTDNHKSVKKIGFILAGALLLGVVVLLVFSGIGVKPKAEAPGQGTETTVEVEESTTGSTEENTAQVEEEVTEEVAPTEEIPDTSNSGVSPEPTEKVTDAEFSGEFTAKGTVSNKYIERVGVQYQFVLEVLLTNDNGSASILYYATKDGYEGISLGDTLEVSYTSDGDGGLAVTSISR